MDSQELKIATLSYLLYRRNFLGAFTESFNAADVLGISNHNYSYEFEIKVSKEDLAKELKAIRYLTGQDTNFRRARGANKVVKHKEYLDTWHALEKTPAIANPFFIPNYFSFVVPPEVVEYAIRGVQGSPYGVFHVENGTLYSEVSPQKIHGFKIEESRILYLLRKASTENLSLREKLKDLTR